MSVYAPNTKELAEEERLINDEAWQAEREFLTDLLARLRDALGDDEYFAVHVSLLARLRARQDYIRNIRSEGDAVGQRLGELARVTPKPRDEIREVQGELTRLRWAERVQRCLYWLLLDIGDALVWRRLGFDRAALTALGQGKRVAWLSDGAGWDAEVAAINQLWESGTFAILNDATTCLRLGDLTCFFDDRVEITEVKAGRVVANDDPQKVRLAEAITLINERRGSLGGIPRAIVRCHEPLDTYLSLLPGALATARRDGRAVVSLSRAQLLLARDLTNGVVEPFDESEARSAAGWPESDVILEFGTTLRRMRDRHYNFSDLAPMALLPIGIEDKVDLLLGQLDFTVWVNVTSIAASGRNPFDRAGDRFRG